MSRYLGPRLRIIRRLGILPGFTRKITKRNFTPGQHGPSKANKKITTSDYSLRFQEKQKLRFNYGISEKQLYGYIKKARKIKGATGTILLQLLEMRLENIIYRLGLAPTISSARQFVNHGHVQVNLKNVNIPSFQCKPNDLIQVKNKLSAINLAKNNLNIKNFINLPSHILFNQDELKAKINFIILRNEVNININELLVVEFYSRK
jgi:small subunit ribosomal protein S4